MYGDIFGCHYLAGDGEGEHYATGIYWEKPRMLLDNLGHRTAPTRKNYPDQNVHFAEAEKP